MIKKTRWYLGNFLGGVLFFVIGRYVLLNKLNKGKILSIYFHNPSIEVFENVISWLVRHKFEIITISKFDKYFSEKKCNTERTALITFDDGWVENLELIPILEKYNIPITLFIATEPILEGQIWLNTVRRNVHKINRLKDKVDLKDLKDLSYKKARFLYEQSKKVRNGQREIMTKDQLFKIAKKVDIGSHTCTHPILTNCDDETIYKELKESDEILTDWGLGTNNVFAYPNGDFDDRVVKILGDTKYKYAFTTEPRIIDLRKDINEYKIPRICIPDGLGKYESLARMSSVWRLFLTIKIW